MSLIVILLSVILVYRSVSDTSEVGRTAAVNNPVVNSQLRSSEYSDGLYSATGNYISPGGQEEIKISLRLADGIITDVSFEPSSDNDTSVFFQEKFMSGYKEFVLGRNINDVKLDYVAGSSLTTKGFNDALDKIKRQART